MNSGQSLDTVRRRVRTGVSDRTKRRALLAALNHPDLVSARLVGRTGYGVLLVGPGGTFSTHLSGIESKGPALTLRGLRKVGLA